MSHLRIFPALILAVAVHASSAATAASKSHLKIYVSPAQPTYNMEGFGRPTALVLNYPDAPSSFTPRQVRLLKGEVLLKQSLPPQTTWYIQPGTVLRSDQIPPQGLQVKLYTGTGSLRQLLCTIDVHYYRVRTGGWQPWYMPDSANNGIWANGAFHPFNPLAKNPPLLYNVSTNLPNGQGYYASLKLRSSAGPVGIKSWILGLHKQP